MFSGDLTLPIVTDHALLRWLERVHGIDLDECRCSLLSTSSKEGASAKQVRGRPIVADHLLIQWLKTECGIDMEAYRVILTQEVEECARAGACNLKKDGVEYRFVNGRLVTVIASKHVRSLARKSI